MNEGDGLVDYDGRQYNYAPVNYIQTPYKKTNLFAMGGFDLTEKIRMEASFRGNFRESKQELAPTPYNSGPFLDPGYPVVMEDGTLRNGVSADKYYLVLALTDAGLSIEPAYQVQRRMAEQDRSFTQDVTQYQFAASMLGTVSENLDWKITYNAGWRDQIDRDFGQYSGPKLAEALGPSAVMRSEDAAEGVRSFVERREANFRGR